MATPETYKLIFIKKGTRVYIPIWLASNTTLQKALECVCLKEQADLTTTNLLCKGKPVLPSASSASFNEGDVLYHDDAQLTFVLVRTYGDEYVPKLCFRIKRSQPLRKLKMAYCKTMCCNVSTRGLGGMGMEFYFEGKKIKDEDTCEKLGMFDDDAIEVRMHDLNGFDREGLKAFWREVGLLDDLKPE